MDGAAGRRVVSSCGKQVCGAKSHMVGSRRVRGWGDLCDAQDEWRSLGCIPLCSEAQGGANWRLRKREVKCRTKPPEVITEEHFVDLEVVAVKGSQRASEVCRCRPA